MTDAVEPTRPGRPPAQRRAGPAGDPVHRPVGGPAVRRRCAGWPSEWGYDGLEIACWGDHFDVARAAEDEAYVAERRDILASTGWAAGPSPTT